MSPTGKSQGWIPCCCHTGVLRSYFQSYAKEVLLHNFFARFCTKRKYLALVVSMLCRYRVYLVRCSFVISCWCAPKFNVKKLRQITKCLCAMELRIAENCTNVPTIGGTPRQTRLHCLLCAQNIFREHFLVRYPLYAYAPWKQNKGKLHQCTNHRGNSMPDQTALFIVSAEHIPHAPFRWDMWCVHLHYWGALAHISTKPVNTSCRRALWLTVLNILRRLCRQCSLIWTPDFSKISYNGIHLGKVFYEP